MIKARSIAPPLPEIAKAAPSAMSASIPSPTAPARDDAFRVASHDILFAPATEVRCDACGAALPGDDDDASDYQVTGRGVYVWARGADVTIEHAPLCASCASAIGMTALARWEIEEEEG